VQGWEAAAQKLSTMTSAIASGNVPDPQRQIDTAKRLDALVGLSKAMLALLDVAPDRTATTGNLTTWAKDNLVFTLRELANGIVDKHKELASQLTEPAAQAELLQGPGIQALQDAISRVDYNRKAANTLYGQADIALATGKLRSFWADNRKELFNRLENESKSTDAAVADWAKTSLVELKGLFVEDLGPTLDNWGKRSTEDIYGLTWQLTDTLRGYKAGACRVLSHGPSSHRYVAEYANQVLDAVMTAVAKDLAEDMRRNRV
jgi:hypothetical protein